MAASGSVCSASMLVLASALALAAGGVRAEAAQPAQPPPSTSSDNSSTSVGEVVVTANRRAERDVNVPVSIQAFSAAQLQSRNIVNTTQLQEVTPGLRMDQTGVFVVPTIRGIGTPVTGSGESPTSIYLDGVYQQTAAGDLFDLVNVASVEVDKGPQGTLWGRNTEAGAIRIYTLDPTNTFDFRALGDIGNYNERKADIYVSGPLVGDVLSGNINAYTRHNDGYLFNRFSGSSTDGQINDFDIMGKLLWKPTDRISLLLKVSHSDNIDQSAANYVAAVDRATGRGFATANIVPGACVATAANPYTVCNAEPSQNRVLQDAVLLKTTINFDWATLTSYSSLTHEHDTEAVEQDSSNLNLAYYHWNIYEQYEQQEFNLTGKVANRLDWVLGVYLAHDWSFQPAFYVTVATGVLPNITGHAVINTGEVLQKDSNYAGYADGNLRVINNLFIDLGVRYSVEPKYVQVAYSPAKTLSNTYYSFTPKASIRYEFAPNTNAYFTYSVGYKSGLFNTTIKLFPVRPETLYAYEAGIKTSHPRWSVDLAGFYYNYNNLQFQNTIAGIGSVTSNAGNAVSYGAEFEGRFAITDDLSLIASAAWTHARYTSFQHAVISYPCTAAITAASLAAGTPYVCSPKASNPGAVLPIVDYGDFQSLNTNVSGAELIRAPEFTMSLGPDYRIPTSYGVFDLSANVYASSRVYMQADDARIFSAQPYVTLDLNASWAPNDHYKFALWGTNVTSVKYINQASPDATSARVRYAPPAQFGATFTYRY